MHAFDPARLDVVAFARASGRLTGRTPQANLARLAAGAVPPPADAAAEVIWSADGLWKQPTAGAPEIRLHLVAHTTVWLTCQRCLQPAPFELALDGRFRFVSGEDEAARLDETAETEDVLALPRWLAINELLEDELILALPIVPRHETCPQPIEFRAEADADSAAPVADPRPNPFAALARLKPAKAAD